MIQLYPQSLSTLCNPIDYKPNRLLCPWNFRQECWNRVPFPIPGDLHDPEIELTSFVSPALPGGSFTTRPSWKPDSVIHIHILFHTLFHYALSPDIECSSLCSTVDIVTNMSLFSVLMRWHVWAPHPVSGIWWAWVLATSSTHLAGKHSLDFSSITW